MSDRPLAAIAAALLGTGRHIEALSRALTVLAFAGLLLPLLARVGPAPYVLLAASAIAGLFQSYASMRVALDAALFRDLADGVCDLPGLDQALLQARLLPPAKAGRPLPARVAGAHRLLRWQGLALVLQASILLAAGLIAR